MGTERHRMLLRVGHGGPAAVVALFNWAEQFVTDPHTCTPTPAGQLHPGNLGTFWALHDQTGDLAALANLAAIVSEYVTARSLTTCATTCEGH